MSLTIFLLGCGEKSEKKEDEEIITEAKAVSQTNEANDALAISDHNLKPVRLNKSLLFKIIPMM